MTTTKVIIGSLDDGTSISAQYNPKELQIDKNVPWQPHSKNNANGLQLEFTGAEGRTMSLVLLFDGYESAGGSGDTGNGTVADLVHTLQRYASVRDPDSKVDDMRRPHHCMVVWGTVIDGTDNTTDNKFQCVITQISTKYNMFSSLGVPLRATVTLTLKEADRLSMATPSGGASGGCTPPAGGGT